MTNRNESKVHVNQGSQKTGKIKKERSAELENGEDNKVKE
ncbi:imidazoleglycerol-phosphate dehydratase [Bacillus sp. S1-R1J2-FB]|nr:imidazoleglycerol-phosphate dehydratase [Bacillus sp. S1-R1J2-FB]